MTVTITTRGGESGSAAGFIGSLGHTPLAEVFRRIAFEERSGDLQVTSPSAIKTVYFDRGFVVFASSDLKSDRLGESMIHAGRISRHEFAVASMLMKDGDRKFGQALIQAGIVSEEELGRHVAAQVNRIVLSLFSVKQGMYSFDERPSIIPVELMVSLSVYRILLEGIRRMSSKKLVLAGLPPLDTKMSIAAEPPFTLDIEKLRPVEKDVLRCARAGASLRSIADELGGNEGVVLRACYGLYAAAVLEAVAGDVATPPRRVQEETGTFVLSEIRRKISEKKEGAEEPAAPVELDAPSENEEAEQPPASALPARTDLLSKARELMLRIWEPFRQLWLRLRREPSAPASSDSHPAEIPAAEMGDAHTPETSPAEPSREGAAPSPENGQSTPRTTSTMEEVGVPPWSMIDAPGQRREEPLGFREDAEDVPSRPATVDARLGVPSWSMRDDPNDPIEGGDSDEEERSNTRPGGSVSVPDWSILSDPTDPGEESIEIRPELPAPDLKSDEARVGPLESLDSELFVELTVDADESSMLNAIPVEEIELEGDGPELEVEIGDEAALEEETDSEPTAPPEVEATPAPSPEPSSSTEPSHRPEAESEPPPADDGMRAKRLQQGGGETRLLRDVKLHFRTRDWEGAVPLLQQLIEVSPANALYRGMLARAMSRHPLMRKDAESHFIEALRLAPQDPELHYWLGLHYKSFGLKSRAYTQFRTTLRIQPQHEGARRQLTGAKKEDALGAVIKKLFG